MTMTSTKRELADMTKSQSLDRSKKEKTPPAGSPSRLDVIGAVTSPLGFFTLVVLIAESLFGLLLAVNKVPENMRSGLIWAMVALIFFLVVAVAGMAILRPESLYKPNRRWAASETTPKIVEERLARLPQIVFEEKPAPSVGVWYQEIRPVLHQAIQYTVPTYYLDVNLMIVDWNIAFDLVFSRLGATLRNKHVKYFIAELQNFDEVMGHAQEFTREVERADPIRRRRAASLCFGEVWRR